jgi:hypothetical protein
VDSPTKTSTDQSIRLTNIIAVVLAASVVVYMLIAWLVAPITASPESANTDIAVMAGAVAVLSFGHLVVAHFLFARGVRSAEKRRRPVERLSGYRVAIIISFAVRESVAIYGLILSLLSGDPMWCLAFGVVTLISMGIGWPARSVMNRLAAEVQPIG